MPTGSGESASSDRQDGFPISHHHFKKMDDLIREAKERFLLEGQKAHIAMHAAGAAMLLAFLQAIWSDIPDLRGPVLFGIIAFAFGVAVGAASYPLRHRALVIGALSANHWLYQLVYWWLPALSISLFLAGLLIPVASGLSIVYGGSAGT